MKVLFLGDSHGNTPFAIKAIAEAHRNGCDFVIQLGDFGVWSGVGGVRFLDGVQEALDLADINLIFTDGNHENFDILYGISVDDDGFRRVRPRIWHAPRGHVWELGGKNFLAMGGAHSIDGPGGPMWWKRRYGQGRGPLDYPMRREPGELSYEAGHDLGGWWPEEMITEDEVAEAIENVVNAKPIDIMIGHDCPEGVDIPGIDGYGLGNLNRKRLRQVFDAARPSLYLGGHYHQRYMDELEGAKVEILAADVNDADQALLVELDDL